MTDKKNPLITENVKGALLKFTFPIICALLLQMMYSAADLMIVGQFSNVANASGVTTGSQVMTLITNFCIGLATGVTILIGQKVGQNQKKDIGSIIVNASFVFLLISVVMMVVLLFAMDAIIAIMNTPEEAIVATRQYLTVCFMGIPMIFAYNVLGSIFRGLGDSVTSLIAVAIACFINIAVDLVLVVGFDMGAMGAGIATVSAQAVSVVLAIIIYKIRGVGQFSLKKENVKISGDIIKKFTLLGIPVAIQSVINNFSFLAITMVVNNFGTVNSVAVGFSEKITGIIMLIPIAFMQSISVFVAQNHAAGEHARVQRGLKVSLIISCAYGIVMGYFAFFHGDILAMIFNSDAEVILATSTYLKAYAIDAVLVPFLFCLSGYFNGLGKTSFVMVKALAGALLLRIPLPFIFGTIEPFSLLLIGLSIPIGTIFEILLIGIYCLYLKKKKSTNASSIPCNQLK